MYSVSCILYLLQSMSLFFIVHGRIPSRQSSYSITVLLTVFPVLHFTLHDYLVTTSLYFSVPPPLLHPALYCPSEQRSVCSLYWWVYFCSVCLFYSLISMYKWNQMVFAILWLMLLSLIPFRSIHAAAKAKISSFLWLSSIPLCTRTTAVLSTCVLMLPPHFLGHEAWAHSTTPQ